MKLRPWFLATVSLGFVALLLLVRGESPVVAAGRLLDEALDPERSSRVDGALARRWMWGVISTHISTHTNCDLVRLLRI